MTGLAAWLDDHGLGQHLKALAESDIDFDLLPSLTDDDLRELGFSIGHRRRFHIAVRESFPPDEATRKSVHGPSPEEAERRQLTVMFCDLVGSTELSERLDPEEMRDLLGRYHAAVAGAVSEYGGHVAKLLGDGVLAYFGWPAAREDAADRALRSALAAVRRVAALEASGCILAARAGIATGPVVIGDMTDGPTGERGAVAGATPNLAARLQSLAGPGEVVTHDGTRRLIGATFDLVERGEQPLKGFAEPVRVWSVTGVAQTRTRFEALHGGPLTDFLGRTHEMVLLSDRWQRARDHEGQAVLISGEAGLGKSRIVDEFARAREAEGSRVLRYQCSPHGTNAQFHPMLAELCAAAGVLPNDSRRTRATRLERHLRDVFGEVGDALPLLAPLLLLPDDVSGAEMTPQRRKQRIIALAVERVARLSGTGPVVVVAEDLHWSDPSTLEALDALVERLRDIPVLLIVTTRPEFAPGWHRHGHVTGHALNRLTRRDSGAIAEKVAGGKTLPDEVLALILARTDGIPLFIEELTKTILEMGMLEERPDCYVLAAGPIREVAIPLTLQDSLMERIDRLATVKRVIQAASCIGREFGPGLLAAATGMRSEEIEPALDRLVSAQLVYRRREPGGDRYVFKHALVQDAAHRSLLKSARQKLHARIAGALEELNPEVGANDPARLARHFSAADTHDRAIPCWLAAGHRAMAVSSYAEALSHLTNALEATGRLADPETAAERELEVRTVMAAATMALRGWPAPEVRRVVEPACALFEQGRGKPEDFVNLWNLCLFHGCRAEHREARAVVIRMKRHAAGSDDPVQSLIAAFASSMLHLWVGDYAQAERDERTTLALYDPERDRDLVWRYNHDPRSTVLSWSAHRVWATGFPDRARALAEEAVSQARRIGHPFNLCWTLGNSSIALGASGDLAGARQRHEELLGIAEEENLDFIGAYMAPATLSVIAAQCEDYEASLADGQRAEAVWRSIGGRFWSPIVLASMGLAAARLGRFDQARGYVREATELLASTGEEMLAEEVYRIQGLVRLECDGDEAGALDSFKRSLRFAGRHGTRSYELRTTISLAGLLADRGERQEAADLLSRAYESFNEGFGTRDLQAAKSLLSDLA